jgi:hypothetical protein
MPDDPEGRETALAQIMARAYDRDKIMP